MYGKQTDQLITPVICYNRHSNMVSRSSILLRTNHSGKRGVIRYIGPRIIHIKPKCGSMLVALKSHMISVNAFAGKESCAALLLPRNGQSVQAYTRKISTVCL